QWKIQRLTLNLGFRFDYFNAYNPAFHYAGGTFVPAFDAPAVKNVPNWKDAAPRLGGAYDIFGTGKTALKDYFGRYLVGQRIGLAQSSHPSLLIASNATRTWNDANGDVVPTCDLKSPLANGECGALTNANFGKINQTTTYADDVLKGYGVRAFNYQGSISVQ